MRRDREEQPPIRVVGESTGIHDALAAILGFTIGALLALPTLIFSGGIW